MVEVLPPAGDRATRRYGTRVLVAGRDVLEGTGLVRGLLVLTVLWLAWSGYTWLTTLVRAESPTVRLTMVLVVALTAMITLAGPQAFNDALGGLSGPLVFVP